MVVGGCVGLEHKRVSVRYGEWHVQWMIEC